jgi:hypothetical protein
MACKKSIRIEVPPHFKNSVLSQHVLHILDESRKRNLRNTDSIDYITVQEVINFDGTTGLVPLVVAKRHPEGYFGKTAWGSSEPPRHRRYFTD